MPYDMPSYPQSTAEMDITSYKPAQRASRLHGCTVQPSSSAHDFFSSSPHHTSTASYSSSSTSHPASPKPFTYDLTRKGKTWGKLTLHGDPALSRSSPAFVEPALHTKGEGATARADELGATVRGEVHLNLDNPETLHSVRVTVRGQISIGASAPFTFLGVSITPWSREMGDPRGEGSHGSSAFKLHGTHTWPFAIPLPRAVTLPVGSPPRERRYQLAANFWERHEPVRVRYYVILQVGRGRWRGDLRLPVEFTYVPWSVPSPARQLAYEGKQPIPPPDADAEGWYTARSVLVSGLVGEGRHEVEVTCCLSLAKPLAYTRGSVIPLALTFESHDAAALTFESHDTAALDLLSAPTAPVVRLRRRLRYKADIGKLDEGDDYEGEGGGGRQSNGDGIARQGNGIARQASGIARQGNGIARQGNGSARPPGTTSWTESTTVYDLASWWPREGAPHHTYRRCLDGEIHLKEDLKPTTEFAHWRVEYEVVLFPFDIPSFVGRDREPLVVQPVEIATAYGSGPRPCAVTAPVFECAGAGV